MNNLEIDKIKSEIAELYTYIPADRAKYTFWNPYLENGKDEFHLYAYSGALTKLYFSGKGLSAANFSKLYIKHFKPQSVGESIRTGFANSNRRAKGLQYIKGWDEKIWESVLAAFDTWSIKSTNSEYERRRQTCICHNHENSEAFQIFVMEKNIKVKDLDGFSDGNPELDICALRYENGKPILSFTEYKCTTSAITGKTTLYKHCRDMIGYYQDKNQKYLFLKLYNRKRLLLGKNEEIIDAGVCKSEIVFLISHIDWKYRWNKNDTGEKKKKKGQVIDPTILLSDLKKVATVENFEAHKENIKVVFLENEESPIIEEMMMSYDDAKRYLEEKIKETATD